MLVALPWFTSWLHVVGNDDVIGPHVILPLVKSHNSRQHKSRMDSDPHVNLHSGRLANVSDITSMLLYYNWC